MDLDFHGYPGFSAELAAAYLSLSRDWPLYLLLSFYKSYRACVRGKVFSFRLEDPAISSHEKELAQQEACRYFLLARQYAEKMNHPVLLLISGLMGTGKSTIARALTDALAWKWLSSDTVRKELAGLSPQARRHEPFQQGIYASDFSERTYLALFAQAGTLLQAGSSVILDASFKREQDRAAALNLAQQMRADFLLIECRCADEIIQNRLSGRLRKENEPSDGRWEIFRGQKEIFEKIRGWDPDLHLCLDTCLPLEECLQRIFRHLLQREAKVFKQEKKEVGR
jgi:hypothetical protein